MKRERQKGIATDRTSNSIDFPQIITIIYINNILQGPGRGKVGTMATGEKHSDGQSVGFFLVPFYRAFLAHFFFKANYHLLEATEGKATKCPECLSASD